MYLLEVPLGIIAGWSVEVGIVIIVLHIASFFIAVALKKKLPLWYYLGFVSFCIGWIILYASPGTHIRGENTEYYMSLSQILALGPSGIFRRILLTFDMEWKRFYYEVFFLVALFLGVTSVFYKPNVKRICLNVLAVVFFAFCIMRLPKLIFMVSVMVLLALNIWFLRKKASWRPIAVYSSVFLAIFFVEFLFVGSTIQMTLPRRGKLQYTLCNAALLAVSMDFCFTTFSKQKRVQAIASVLLIFGTVAFSCWVGIECFDMWKKWNAMEQTVAEQKALGKREIVVPKETFISAYWGYDGFAVPHIGEDEASINEMFAWYYGVEKYRVE